MGSINRNRVISLAFLIILESFGGASKVTAISAYSPTTSFSHIEPSQSSHSQHQISASSIKDSFAERRKHSGNVIFNDNHAFSPSPTLAENEGSKRKKSLGDEQNSEYSHHILAGGYLKNHRLEEGHISASSAADAVSASAAAAVVSPNFYNNINDQVNDNSQHNNVHRAVGVGARGGEGVAIGVGTHGRAFSQYNQGSHHGWASNPGSCLFSCSGGNIGNGAVSCCQQNYVQCCPNPHQETLNFKNLHHGRGLIGGNFGKSGYSWGPAPYNPPPIIRKPCQPQPYSFHPGIVSPAVGGAGALLHKGVETIKNSFHNIGHLFKDHVEGGIGWGAGGNGAAGHYFHRRSDKNSDYIVDERSHSPQKRRLVRRSIPKGGEFVQPCPVYSVPPNYGWPSRPQSVGLGSLIGWSRPVNHIQTGFLGGGGYYSGGLHQQQHVPGAGGGGYGWGGSVGRGFCKWDYECPGIQKCCKGTCQLTPYK